MSYTFPVRRLRLDAVSFVGRRVCRGANARVCGDEQSDSRPDRRRRQKRGRCPALRHMQPFSDEKSTPTIAIAWSRDGNDDGAHMHIQICTFRSWGRVEACRSLATLDVEALHLDVEAHSECARGRSSRSGMTSLTSTASSPSTRSSSASSQYAPSSVHSRAICAPVLTSRVLLPACIPLPRGLGHLFCAQDRGTTASIFPCLFLPDLLC